MPRAEVMDRFFLAVIFALFAGGCARFEAKPLSSIETAAEFNARSIDSPGLKQFIDTNLHHPLAEWPPGEWDFSMLTLVAFYFHPSLDVARAQWAVAEAGIKTAGGRPNPVLTVTPGYSSNPAQGLSPWFPMVSVDVPIETAGKRRKRISHAGHVSESARLNIYIVAWQVRSQLRSVLLEWSAWRERSELLQRQLNLQEEVVKLLDQRLAAGAVAATEITPARLARLKLIGDLAEANRQTAATRVRLGEALGLPAKNVALIQIASKPPLPPESADILLSIDARNRALQTRPDVQAALADYAAAESALQLEIAKQYPDLHLSPGYQFDQGEHKWSLGLAMELPMLNRNQGPIAEAEARRTESAARFLALQARVISEMDRAAQMYATIREQLHSSQILVEAQRKQADSLQSAFRAGGADRFEVDSARLEAAIGDLAVLDAKNRIQQTLGQLEDALQIPFEGLLAVERDGNSQATRGSQ